MDDPYSPFTPLEGRGLRERLFGESTKDILDRLKRAYSASFPGSENIRLYRAKVFLYEPNSRRTFVDNILAAGSIPTVMRIDREPTIEEVADLLTQVYGWDLSTERYHKLSITEKDGVSEKNLRVLVDQSEIGALLETASTHVGITKNMRHWASHGAIQRIHQINLPAYRNP